MKKPSIRQPGARADLATTQCLGDIIENIEVMTGRRGGKIEKAEVISSMTTDQKIDEVARKLNALIDRMNS